MQEEKGRNKWPRRRSGMDWPWRKGGITAGGDKEKDLPEAPAEAP